MELRDIAGRSVRALVGDSVYEPALVTVHEGVVFIEFETDELDAISLDFRQVYPAQTR